MKPNSIASRGFVMKALAFAVVAASPAPVMAQGTLEEIIVSARKTDETLQSVPIAVSAFNAEDMAAMNVVQTSDVGRFTPSVYIEPPAAGNATAAKVTIRGQNQADSLITLDPSVGWYLDDIYLARAYGTVASLFDAERVEVLKGPQGTLYGRNTTGGAVKIITTKAEPSSGVNGFVTGGIGNYDAGKVGGAINIPIIEDVLAVRLAALKDTANGYGTVNVYDSQLNPAGIGHTLLDRKDAGFRDTEMYRLNVTWLPTDAMDVQFGYEHSELDVSTIQRNIAGNRDSAALSGIAASRDFYDTNLNGAPRSMAEADTVNLTISYDLTDTVNTRLIYGWRRVDSTFMSDIDGTPASINDFFTPSEQYAKQQSVEWQISGVAMQDLMEWMTGLYWFEEEGSDATYSWAGGADPNGVPGDFAYGINQNYAKAKNKSKSVFVNTTLHLTDKVDFTGGLRYSKDDKPLYKRLPRTPLVGSLGNVTCRLDATVPNFNAADCSSYDSDSYEFVSWQAGFNYNISDETMTYIKASKASRSGGQNSRGMNAATSEPFEPENATDIELGIKSQLLDNRLRVNANVFHTFYEDIQQAVLGSIPPYGSYTQVVNQAEADVDGFEFEVTALVTDGLKATVTGSLLNWDFKDDTSILQSAPTEQYSARLDYSLPVPMGVVDLTANYSYRGEYFGNARTRDTVRTNPYATVDSVGLVSARAALTIDAWDVTVAAWGNNLSNEKYTTSPLILSSTIVNAVVGEPRTYGLDVTKRF